MQSQERFFKLSNGPGGLGLRCDSEGVMLAGVPLLRSSANGLEPRPAAQIAALAERAYGVDIDTAQLTAGLGVVARALNAGDAARAMTAAVLLKLPDLDWAGAVRIAQAEDMLRKYSPDQPRDWHGRWTNGDGGGPDVVAESSTLTGTPNLPLTQINVHEDNVAGQGDGATDTAGNTANPFALPADWVHLPPGERIDELADLAEWIANAKPEDESAIRADIKRLFYDVGDVQGGNGVNALLSDALEPGISVKDRQDILLGLDRFTHTDPAEVAQFSTGQVSSILLSGSALLETPAIATPAIIAETPQIASDVWKLGWAARGFQIEKALGGNLAHNFPVIDSFAEGMATSIKSIDLNAGVYQNAARLTSRLNAYVNKVATFNGAQLGEDEVLAENITGRALNVAIPKGSSTAAQRAALRAAQTRANGLGVNMIVTPF